MPLVSQNTAYSFNVWLKYLVNKVWNQNLWECVAPLINPSYCICQQHVSMKVDHNIIICFLICYFMVKFQRLPLNALHNDTSSKTLKVNAI